MADTTLGRAGDQDGLTVEPSGELGVELAHTLLPSGKSMHARALREGVVSRAAHTAVVPPSTGRGAPVNVAVVRLVLCRDPAPVDGKSDAVDEAGIVTGEEDDRRGKFLGLSHATCWR